MPYEFVLKLKLSIKVSVKKKFKHIKLLSSLWKLLSENKNMIMATITRIMMMIMMVMMMMMIKIMIKMKMVIMNRIIISSSKGVKNLFFSYY